MTTLEFSPPRSGLLSRTSLKLMAACIAAAGLFLSKPFEAQAQRADKVYRIGCVSPTTPCLPSATFEAFLQSMKELGYVEGRNVIYEYRSAEGRPERLPELVAELLRMKVDAIVTGGTVSALAAKKATATVPIVFATVFDPVATGLVASLARPGGNVTGLAMGVGGSGFGGKWVELLKESIPNLSHVGVLWNSANPASAPLVREIQAAARILNVKLDLRDAGNPASLDKAFAAFSTSGAQGIIVTNDPFFNAYRAQIAQFAVTKRLPAVHFSKLFVDAGGLMSYGASFEESWRRAARYMDKILKGAKPADLPVEQPTRFELAINMKVARALGLTIPPLLLLRADHVID